MRKSYNNFYPYTPEELDYFWKNGLVILDTNILLHEIYDYNDSVRNEWFEVLQKLRDSSRLWMPFQIGLEYFKNRPKVIAEKRAIKDLVIGQLESAKQGIDKSLTDHQNQYEDKEVAAIKDVAKSLDKSIKELRRLNNISFNNDRICKRLCELYDGLVGPEPTPEELLQWEADYEKHYDEKKPPGITDVEKKDGETCCYGYKPKYGDQYIWSQIKNHTQGKGIPVIFVTNDCKEEGDWLLTRKPDKGKKIEIVGTHPYLRKDFNKFTGQDIYICQSSTFLHYVSKNLGVDTSKASDAEKNSAVRIWHRKDLKNRDYEINWMPAWELSDLGGGENGTPTLLYERLEKESARLDGIRKRMLELSTEINKYEYRAEAASDEERFFYEVMLKEKTSNLIMLQERALRTKNEIQRIKDMLINEDDTFYSP